MGSVSTREAGVQVGLAAQQLVRSASRLKTGSKKGNGLDLMKKLGEIRKMRLIEKDRVGGELMKMRIEGGRGRREKGKKISGKTVRSQDGEKFGGGRGRGREKELIGGRPRFR